MVKMILAFLPLTIIIGLLILAIMGSEKRSRSIAMRWIGFSILCASIAFFVLVLVVNLF